LDGFGQAGHPRAVELTKELTVGNPTDSATFMGPVIDHSAFKKITEYIEIGKNEGRLMVGGEADDSKGYFIQPTIIADLAPEARIMKEEIFGPVVAFSKARDFDEALEIANNTDYGLTGAVITTTITALEQAEHFCPAKPKADATIDFAANSRSASLSTTMVSFPPISAMTRFSHFWPSCTLEARIGRKSNAGSIQNF